MGAMQNNGYPRKTNMVIFEGMPKRGRHHNTYLCGRESMCQDESNTALVTIFTSSDSTAQYKYHLRHLKQTTNDQPLARTVAYLASAASAPPILKKSELTTARLISSKSCTWPRV